MIARFQREAQAAGRIGNDHILEVLDLGALPDGSHFMVLEFLDGEPLSARVQRLGRLTPTQAAVIGRQILKGLGAAHGAGIIHRDLKPDNIFILKEKAGTPDYVKIIDFGISKFQPLSGDGMKMTSTGAVMGTPYYMSPEQASGSREADGRSDLYSVGVILYECVTGRVPFDGETFNQLMFKIVLSDPPHPQEVVPDLDAAFTSIILKSMARDVAQRFQSAQEFTDALAAWIKSGAQVSVPPPPASEALVPGAVSGAGAPRATNGSWATSQPGATPARSTVIVAAIAGGLMLVVGVIGAMLLLRGGDRSAANAPPSAQAAPAAAAPALSTAPAPPAVGLVPTAPSPSPSAAAGESTKPTALPQKVAAAVRPATKSVAAAPKASAPKAKKGAESKAAAASGGPDFGY